MKTRMGTLSCRSNGSLAKILLSWKLHMDPGLRQSGSLHCRYLDVKSNTSLQVMKPLPITVLMRWFRFFQDLIETLVRGGKGARKAYQHFGCFLSRPLPRAASEKKFAGHGMSACICCMYIWWVDVVSIDLSELVSAVPLTSDVRIPISYAHCLLW